MQRSRPAGGFIGVPPWMWCWCVLFLSSFPSLIQQWQASYDQLRAHVAWVDRMRGLDPSYDRFACLTYPGFFLERIPSAVLLIGLVTVACPHLRAAYIQRRNRLDSPTGVQSLKEIEAFVCQHAPQLQVKANLARPGRIWVYANGYRGATLAVYGGFLVLWKRDRQAAEAVLLHEIAHCRRGDALFLGPGSLIETALKLGLACYVLLFLVPQLVIWIDKIFVFSDVNESGLFDVPLLLKYCTSTGWMLIAGTLTFGLWLAIAFVLPIACVWAAEINADWFAIRAAGQESPLLGELSKAGATTWWRWILFRISHPPDRLRGFFIRNRDRWPAMLVLLMFPLALLVRIGILHLWTIPQYAGIIGTSAIYEQAVTVMTWPHFLQNVVSNTRLAITGMPWGWCLMGALLVAWPLIAPWWDRVFSKCGTPASMDTAETLPGGDPQLTPSPTEAWPSLVCYAISSAVCAALAVLAFVWRE